MATSTESKASSSVAILSKKIGIIGSGQVGQLLAAGLSSKGYQVTIGSRTPSSDALVKWQKEKAPLVKLADLPSTSSFGDIIFLATSWAGTKPALDLALPANFVGKTVLDTTNPLNAQYQITDGTTNSGGELVQSWLPGAHVVKALNSIGFVHMIDPDFKGSKPDAFIAGDNEAAKKQVTELFDTIGWRDHVVDTGGIVESRLLEPLALLWIRLLVKNGYSTNHGFALLRK